MATGHTENDTVSCYLPIIAFTIYDPISAFQVVSAYPSPSQFSNTGANHTYTCGSLTRSSCGINQTIAGQSNNFEDKLFSANDILNNSLQLTSVINDTSVINYNASCDFYTCYKAESGITQTCGVSCTLYTLRSTSSNPISDNTFSISTTPNYTPTSIMNASSVMSSHFMDTMSDFSFNSMYLGTKQNGAWSIATTTQPITTINQIPISFNICAETTKNKDDNHTGTCTSIYTLYSGPGAPLLNPVPIQNNSTSTMNVPGTFSMRYYYPMINSTTLFSNWTSTISQLISYVNKLPLPSTTIGVSTIPFYKTSSFPYFITTTLLYIMLYFFYGQLYHYNEFSVPENNPYTSYDVLSQLQQFTSFITSIYRSITSVLVSSPSTSSFLRVSSSVFTQCCVYPTVSFIDTTLNKVYIDMCVPITMLQVLHTQTLQQQEQTLSQWMRNFLQEDPSGHYTMATSTDQLPMTSAVYQLQKYDRIGTPFTPNGTIQDFITVLATNGQTFHIDMNQSYATYTNIDSSSNPTYPAYSVGSQTPCPYLLYGIFRLSVVKWSVKLAAYCMSQFPNAPSSVGSQQSLTIASILPLLSNQGIFSQIASDTNWMPNDRYTYLAGNDSSTIPHQLSTYCNTYYTSTNQVYDKISPWFVTPTGALVTQSQNDCLCAFSLLQPNVYTDLSTNRISAQCYDQHCYQSLSPILQAYGISAETCSSNETCGIVNTWLTTTDSTNQSSDPSMLDATMYVKNCGSLYQFNPDKQFYNKEIIWMGCVYSLLILLFTLVICVYRQYSVSTIIVWCIIVLAICAVLTYYASSIFTGKWTCASFGALANRNGTFNPISNNQSTTTVSTPICVSSVYPTFQIPDECCNGAQSTSCECVVDQNCNCYSNTGVYEGASTCNSGKCVLTDSSGGRPTTTVSTTTTSYLLILFFSILAICLPLLIDLYKRTFHWNIPTILYGIMVLVLFSVPIVFLYLKSFMKTQKTVTTDSCTIAT